MYGAVFCNPIISVGLRGFPRKLRHASALQILCTYKRLRPLFPDFSNGKLIGEKLLTGTVLGRMFFLFFLFSLIILFKSLVMRYDVDG